MANLFKLRYIPNPDGTDSGILSTNVNTVFVHTYAGDNNNGDGTRAFPYTKLATANAKAILIGASYIVFRGLINEAFSTDKTIIGDDINQNLVTSNYVTQIINTLRVTLDKVSTDLALAKKYDNTIITNFCINGSNNNGLTHIKYSLFKGGLLVQGQSGNGNYTYNNTTFYSFGYSNYEDTTERLGISRNNIIYGYRNINPSNSAILKSWTHILSMASTIFKYNNINIAQPAFTNDSKATIQLLRDAYVAKGMTVANSLFLFPKDSFGNETCLVINEQRSGGTHPNVFNKYEPNATGILNASISGAKTTIVLNTIAGIFPPAGDIFMRMADGTADVFTYTSWTIAAGIITFTGLSQTLRSHLVGEVCTRYGDVLDFSLNPDPLNEALWASDTGGFVGCYRPTQAKDIAESIIENVNALGESAGTGDLVYIDANGIGFQTSPTGQVWNRITDSVVTEIKKGSKFTGGQVKSDDGSPFGHIIGKYQNLIDPVAKNAGEQLTVGKLYKVCNVVHSVSQAIVYNGIQYLPDYFFRCVAGATTYSLLNEGSGTIVKMLLADPLESMEILPYDSLEDVSSFPRFSVPLMGECKILFYNVAGANRYGKIVGAPVLFGDCAAAQFQADFPNVCDKISYYNNWAITNADQEFYTLSSSTYFSNSIPVLRFYKKELNFHFDVAYDY